jgi:hypothetical protein
MTTEGRVDCMSVVRFYGVARRRSPTDGVRLARSDGRPLTRTRARGRVESASFRGSPPSRAVC